mmetsp:Transcript_1689/g.3949  ORF Transcript_1689/g.3949 Transcript_1689/m.3949 type:complete len:283 (-) Transcript_1689:530-1378(-)
MAHNPLLGSRISLISKKNIRYEGTLYSINEAESTVALENVRSYGTEGRELLDTTGASTFVPPQDIVHAYLLFRGQDIKDLHVHEKASEASSPAASASGANAEAAAPSGEDASSKGNDEENASEPPAEKRDVESTGRKNQAPTSTTATSRGNNARNKEEARSQKSEKSEGKANAVANEGGAGGNKSDGKGGDVSNKPAQKKGTGQRRKNGNMVGTGASLLNRKARGVKGDQAQPEVDGEFDFESNLAEFDKAKITSDDDPDEDHDASNPDDEDGNVYSKGDFF